MHVSLLSGTNDEADKTGTEFIQMVLHILGAKHYGMRLELIWN